MIISEEFYGEEVLKLGYKVNRAASLRSLEMHQQKKWKAQPQDLRSCVE